MARWVARNGVEARVGQRANLIVIREDGWQIYHDHWRANRLDVELVWEGRRRTSRWRTVYRRCVSVLSDIDQLPSTAFICSLRRCCCITRYSSSR